MNHKNQEVNRKNSDLQERQRAVVDRFAAVRADRSSAEQTCVLTCFLLLTTIPSLPPHYLSSHVINPSTHSPHPSSSHLSPQPEKPERRSRSPPARALQIRQRLRGHHLLAQEQPAPVPDGDLRACDRELDGARQAVRECGRGVF